MISVTYKVARRIVIAMVGATLLLIGVALLFLPGPGLATILAGLAVLAIEFVWARRLLKRAREKIADVTGSITLAGTMVGRFSARLRSLYVRARLRIAAAWARLTRRTRAAP